MAFDAIVDTRTNPRLKPGEGQCDFCSSRHPVYWFPCQNFTHTAPRVRHMQITGIMTEEWAACERCTLLVLDGRYDRLAERALVGHPLYGRIGSANRAEFIVVIRGLHAAFQRSRLIGPPAPVELIREG